MAGSNSAIKMPMIAITTSNSTSVKPLLRKGKLTKRLLTKKWTDKEGKSKSTILTNHDRPGAPETGNGATCYFVTTRSYLPGDGLLTTSTDSVVVSGEVNFLLTLICLSSSGLDILRVSTTTLYQPGGVPSA